jgi:thioesterase domain-containing protein
MCVAGLVRAMIHLQTWGIRADRFQQGSYTMTDTDHAALAAQLQAYILEHIPLARTMELRVTRHDGVALDMAAPLAPNINDKGCAFGGSMASLMTLAGWGLVELALRARGIECDIYVGDSTVRYREPLFGELRATARFAEAEGLDVFLKTLAARGKARIQVVCAIAGEKQDAATLEAAFVAKCR